MQNGNHSDTHTEYLAGFGVKVNCRKAAREDALGYLDEPLHICGTS
ncbi:MAG: hypothetical protein U0M60_23810 [Clostridia bacterium]|nr:hypothetical protein [Clostridia bacterium]